MGLDLETTRYRKVHIYTWGCDNGKTQAGVQMLPGKPKVHLDARSLNGRGGGADLSCDATQEPQIVRNVITSMKEGRGREWLVAAVRRIECGSDGRSGSQACISVYCSKGRHRSVGAALILQALVYPNATFEHLTR